MVKLDMENGEEANKLAAAHSFIKHIIVTQKCSYQEAAHESPEQVYLEKLTHRLLLLTYCYGEILDRNRLEEEGGSAPPGWMWIRQLRPLGLWCWQEPEGQSTRTLS